MIPGFGFLVWHLSAIQPIESTISVLKKIGASWLSIKFLDGALPFNLDANGSNASLVDAVAKLKAAGIAVGGWGFVYTMSLEKEATAACKMVQDYGLSHWLIDAEDVNIPGADWKRGTGLDAKAKLYMDNLRLPTGFPAGLCSYRYPSYHPQFPFNAFIKHPRNTLNAPQVYWMFANNPGYQTKKSKGEYDKIRTQPFIPIGSSFCEHGWCTTTADIKEFVSTCKELKLPGWGFWDLDEAIKRPDWLMAMSGAEDVDPEPPEEPTPDEPKVYWVEHVATSVLNVRSAIVPSVKFGKVPGVIYAPSKVWMTIPNGYPVDVLEVIPDGKNIWYRIGTKQFVAKQYDGNIFLKK